MRILIFISLIVFVLLQGCGEPAQERIQRLLDDRIRLEQLRLEAECRRRLITEASAAVDSLIIERALSDTTSNYIRPPRPDVPNLVIPDIDTLGIQPLFIEKDTIQ